MKNAQRLLRLEAVKRATPQPKTRGPGIATEGRLRRIRDAIQKHEAEFGPSPPMDWSQQIDNSFLEGLRLKIVAQRERETSGSDLK